MLLSHGGVEMGQGIDTKMLQIAALQLNVPMDIIRTSTSSTEKVYILNLRLVIHNNNIIGMIIVILLYLFKYRSPTPNSSHPL